MLTESTAEDVLTLTEAAKLLQVSEKALSKEAKNARVPHFRIGRQYRFVRGELIAWAKSGVAKSREATSQ